ncbi:hypothetical protein BCF11_4843 [Collimonas sp. PA-H2]|uniref:hypothetical protein n=1 Tax=Collimonas sp. PA-H2 TaxID=1881062 RepID=UPI000BF26BCB|nr:hypothetical protein [Collimonas sp. PA-H2]PFH12363.1 hypothetical protein BCF11_4843 [Collimonas sp. PA-H2]
MRNSWLLMLCVLALSVNAQTRTQAAGAELVKKKELECAQEKARLDSVKRDLDSQKRRLDYVESGQTVSPERTRQERLRLNAQKIRDYQARCVEQ